MYTVRTRVPILEFGNERPRADCTVEWHLIRFWNFGTSFAFLFCAQYCRKALDFQKFWGSQSHSVAAQSASVASHWNLIYSWGIAAPTKGQVSTPTTLHQQADTPLDNTPSHRVTRESLYSRGIPSHARTASDAEQRTRWENQFWQCRWRQRVSNIISIFISIFWGVFSTIDQVPSKSPETFYFPKTYQVAQLDSWASSLFYCLTYSTETETRWETFSCFSSPLSL